MNQSIDRRCRRRCIHRKLAVAWPSAISCEEAVPRTVSIDEWLAGAHAAVCLGAHCTRTSCLDSA